MAAIAVAVCWPTVIRLRHAAAQTMPALAPSAPAPKAQPINTFPTVDPKKVVLTVGEQKVTVAEFQAFFSELEPQFQQRVLSQPQGRRQLAEEFVNLKLMASEAKRQKLDESLRFKTTYDQLLSNALMLTLAEDKNGNIQFYDANKDWFTEIQMRHILIAVANSGIEGIKRNEEEAIGLAKQIKRKIDAGADFGTLARENSDDRGSAAAGGNLGFVQRGQMTQAFEDAAFALKDGQTSEPIRTPYGFHIIQALSHVAVGYEKAAGRIPQRRLTLLVEQLKKSHKPEIDDSYFGGSIER